MNLGTIVSIKDLDGNDKESGIIGKEVEIYPLTVGGFAILAYTEKGTEYSGRCCRTSTIKSIYTDENVTTITTRNSVYKIEKNN